MVFFSSSAKSPRAVIIRGSAFLLCKRHSFGPKASHRPEPRISRIIKGRILANFPERDINYFKPIKIAPTSLPLKAEDDLGRVEIHQYTNYIDGRRNEWAGSNGCVKIKSFQNKGDHGPKSCRHCHGKKDGEPDDNS